MQSQQLFQRANARIPGGVNSPVRAFASVGGNPVFIERGQGARIIDVEGNSYVDYVGSWGPAILGHAHPAVVEAVCDTATNGLGFGAPHRLEVELAETLCRILPWIDKLRMVSSGTEATMSAIRLARGYTDRSRIIKFEGCYHGHADCLLVKAGSGALTLGQPSSAGVPEATTSDTLVLPYNDTTALEQAFAQQGNQLAAVIIEPVAGNMNMVPALPDYINKLRQLCSDNGTVLIFDEVMSGFRVALGGATALYGVEPDLACYGKVVGGGMPVGMFAGKADIMDTIAPLGPVYQAGTLSGNPVAMAAGLATLSVLESEPEVYQQMEDTIHAMLTEIQTRATSAGIDFQYTVRGSMFGLFFTNQPRIESFEQVMACNQDRFRQFFHAMLQRGVYLAPSAFEAGFMSLAHGTTDVEQTIEAATASFTEIQQ